jgi:hypothetical protein
VPDESGLRISGSGFVVPPQALPHGAFPSPQRSRDPMLPDASAAVASCGFINY